MTERTSLYRLFDLHGDLLYVGIARNYAKRFVQHAESKAWWNEVANLRVEFHGSRQRALRAEAVAIRDEAPRYNIAQPTVDPLFIRWQELVAREPRLARIEELCDWLWTQPSHCWEEDWYGQHGVKRNMSKLVGWDRDPDGSREAHARDLMDSLIEAKLHAGASPFEARTFSGTELMEMKFLPQPNDGLDTMEAYDVAYDYLSSIYPWECGAECTHKRETYEWAS